MMHDDDPSMVAVQKWQLWYGKGERRVETASVVWKRRSPFGNVLQMLDPRPRVWKRRSSFGNGVRRLEMQRGTRVGTEFQTEIILRDFA